MSWEDIIKSRELDSQTRLLRRLDAIVQVAESTIKGLGDTDEAIGLSEDEIEKRMMEIIKIATGKK
jgi:hypothetical protein